MKKHLSTVAIIIVTIIATLIVGGLALLSLGNAPIYILLCNLLGLILFIIGGFAAIMVIGIIIINISDRIHPPNDKKNWLLRPASLPNIW